MDDFIDATKASVAENSVAGPVGAEIDPVRLTHYKKRLAKIDDLLSQAVGSLIDVAAEYFPCEDPLRPAPAHDGGDAENGDRPVYFPPWVMENTDAPVGHYILTRAICSAALLRVDRIRRRFPGLERSLRKYKKKRIRERISATFVPKASTDWGEVVKRLHSDTFGTLNPLTSAHVFSVLMDTGELQAHSEMGLLSFFSIMWSMQRRIPEAEPYGANLGPWGPTAYATAKCLLPLRALQSACTQRKTLLLEMKKVLRDLEERSSGCNAYSKWQFDYCVEQLGSLVEAFAPLALDRGTADRCATELLALADKLEPGSNRCNTCGSVIAKLREMHENGLKEAQEVVKRGQWIQKEILTSIVEKVTEGTESWNGILLESLPEGDPVYQFRMPVEWRESGTFNGALADGARRAFNLLEEVLTILSASIPKEERPRQGGAGGKCDKEETLGDVLEGLDAMVAENEAIVGLLEKACRPHARWCRRVAEQQMAYAAAGNDTDFDPSELVSAVATAVRWGEMTSPLEIGTAVRSAMRGMRPDGSWGWGQPFYATGRALSVFPTTSDTIWTLATAITDCPEITDADVAFEAYVDWLERSLMTVRVSSGKTREEDESDELGKDDLRVKGWPSDRFRGQRRIDLWATALAVNALLQVRDVIELRLWQMAERRFTVLESRSGLETIDPVDLGREHRHRLHRTLAAMARTTTGEKWEGSRYSVLLHGPPGTSKTAITRALGAEMWRRVGRTGGPHVIRVTPADFTRLGEERVDSEARLIFELLGSVRGVTILFDEIDDLLRRRPIGGDVSFLRLVTPAMLNRLQDLRDRCPQQELCFIVATNYVEQIEPTLLRKGRMDKRLPVVYPDLPSREAILHKNLRDANSSFVTKVAMRTGGWSWLGLRELCRGEPKAEVRNGEGNNSDIDGVLEGVEIEVWASDYWKRTRREIENRGAVSRELLTEIVDYAIAKHWEWEEDDEEDENRREMLRGYICDPSEIEGPVGDATDPLKEALEIVDKRL